MRKTGLADFERSISRAVRAEVERVAPADRLAALQWLLTCTMTYASELAHEPKATRFGEGAVPEVDRAHARDLMEILYPLTLGLVPFDRAVVGAVQSGARRATKTIIAKTPNMAEFVRGLGEPEQVLHRAVLKRVRAGTTTSALAPYLRVFVSARGALLNADLVEDRAAVPDPLDAKIARAISRYADGGGIHVPRAVACRRVGERPRRGRVHGEQECRCSECITVRIIKRARAVQRSARG
ncbi:MAG: hypothetical protein KIT84_11465 [Labilithrix sp.]|nr:hypothetical protein [Labilithrix sp.]MCW5811628.1 hypothetical protein [Labilithrix sp.]